MTFLSDRPYSSAGTTTPKYYNRGGLNDAVTSHRSGSPGTYTFKVPADSAAGENPRPGLQTAPFGLREETGSEPSGLFLCSRREDPPLRTSSKPKTSKGATSKHGRIEDEASTYEIWGNTNPLSLIAATLRSAFLSTDQQRKEAGTRRSLGFPEHLLPPPLFSCLQGYWGGQSFPYLPR